MKQKKEMIDKILDNFDFEKARAILVLMGIEFLDEPGISYSRHTPTIEELRENAISLLDEAWEERQKWQKDGDNMTGISCQYLTVEIENEMLELQFTPITSPCFFDEF